MGENKYYYIVFLAFITQKINVNTSQPGMHSIAKHSSAVTNKHPLKWKYEELLGKNRKEYDVHIQWWTELTREEFEDALRYEHMLGAGGNITN